MVIASKRIDSIVILFMVLISCHSFNSNSINDHAEFVKIKKGFFYSGNITNVNLPGKEDISPERYEIADNYYLGRTECTQGQWLKVMHYNPSAIKDDMLPVDNVTYEEIMTYLEKKSKIDGVNYRLPTRKEWEYAYRANEESAFYFGEYSVDRETLDRYAWHTLNSNNRTHIVGTKLPNEWGLFDMNGNVSEYVIDDLRPNDVYIVGGDSKGGNKHFPYKLLLLPFLSLPWEKNKKKDFIGFRILREAE